MFELRPVTERVRRVRQKYRDTTPEMCTARLRLITDFYQKNCRLTGILKRAYAFKYLCEKMPVIIFDDEVIVGSQATTYHSSALYPEFGGIEWFRKDLEAGVLTNREHDNYIVRDEDVDYVLSIVDFWNDWNCSDRLSEYIPEGYLKSVGNGVFSCGGSHICVNPIGHFCANYDKLLHRGFRSLYEEAKENMEALEGHLYGEDVDKYNFYRAVCIVLEGIMHFAKRYAQYSRELAQQAETPERKAELERTAGCLENISEKPAGSYQEAVQLLYFYHMGLCLDGQLHGISFGRIDQYFYPYYKEDVEKGVITPEYAQEILDLFYIKCAEMNKMGPNSNAIAAGYTNGMLMTLGGVDKLGNDASNDVTFMMIQSAARLVLHDPPQALRIHKNTPKEVWEAALECTRRCGGVPTFENDDIIIPALRKRGMSLESARNYCLIGCVEPAGTGDHWSMCGGTGGLECYWNMANCYLQAINNGINPFPNPDGSPNTVQTGLPTGYLYEMDSFEDLLIAVKKQMKFFIDWQISIMNTQEKITAQEIPLPLVSATMDGCMESGKDVMYGGARYNSSGLPGIAIGNLVDSLAITKYLVFDEKICTARELYDAVLNNWEGFEELHEIVMHRVPRYGNGNEYCDRFVKWVSDTFAELVNQGVNYRNAGFFAGLFPVAFNVFYGMFTAATPDGRYLGQPLSDGISPMQGVDTHGPTVLLSSIMNYMDQSQFPNGTLLNLKIHPSAFANETGLQKVTNLMQTYFAKGGMELQLNILSTETLKKAKENPEEYRDLVVRVAGFSAYFVELTKGSQEDIISRTEISM